MVVQRVQSFRVFLTPGNDVAVRCWNCGLSGSVLNLLRELSGRAGSWADLIELLRENRVFGDGPVDEGWVERQKAWESFANCFETAKAHHRLDCRYTDWDGPRFGEIGATSGDAVRRLFPKVELPIRWGDGLFYLELYRSLTGLPLEVVICGKTGAQFCSYRFHPAEPIQLLISADAFWHDWTEEIVLATDRSVAADLEQQAAQLPPGNRLPIAFIERASTPVLEEIPFRKIRYVVGPRENGEFGLAFVHCGARVRVCRAEEENVVVCHAMPGRDALDVVADEILATHETGKNPIPLLNAILEKPWVADETARRLTHAVAVRLGEATEVLIRQSGATRNMLPLKATKAHFLARNGVYLKAADRQRQDFQACSNFSLRLEETWVDADGEAYHRLLLLLGPQSTEFEISDHDLGFGTRLMSAATKAAVRSSFSTLPHFFNTGDDRQLPGLVKGTGLPIPSKIPQSNKLGFDQGGFRGIDFTATATGIRPARNGGGSRNGTWIKTADSAVLPFLGSGDLKRKANLLATWINALPERSQRSVGVVLYAALQWLHRAARGLDSFLLLPSQAHLDLMGEICGLIPIQVGRSREFRWAPRLMASFYHTEKQAQRHGHVVAALEAPDHRLHPNLFVVAHQMGDEAISEPPGSSFLSLLAYASLGTESIDEAVMKLGNLPEDRSLRDTLKGCLRTGGWYLTRVGDYLETFLNAVERHYGLTSSIIESSRGPLLRRDVVKWLSNNFDYSFRELLLIDELRETTGQEQPTRYGGEQVPVFLLPKALLKSNPALTPSPDPEPVSSPEFQRTELGIKAIIPHPFPAPVIPITTPRPQLSPSICITKMGE